MLEIYVWIVSGRCRLIFVPTVNALIWQDCCQVWPRKIFFQRNFVRRSIAQKSNSFGNTFFQIFECSYTFRNVRISFAGFSNNYSSLIKIWFVLRFLMDELYLPFYWFYLNYVFVQINLNIYILCHILVHSFYEKLIWNPRTEYDYEKLACDLCLSTSLSTGKRELFKIPNLFTEYSFIKKMKNFARERS